MLDYTGSLLILNQGWMMKLMLLFLLLLQGNIIMHAYTVICIVEAKPGKETELKKLLTDVIEPSRKEKTCLDYRLHQDLNNAAQFVLYETWESKSAHEEQFKKPYIIELGSKLGDLLAKPYIFIAAEDVSAQN